VLPSHTVDRCSLPSIGDVALRYHHPPARQEDPKHPVRRASAQNLFAAADITSPQIVRKNSGRDQERSATVNDEKSAFTQVRAPFRRNSATASSSQSRAGNFPWYY
jgi:hypothetical protein